MLQKLAEQETSFGPLDVHFHVETSDDVVSMNQFNMYPESSLLEVKQKSVLVKLF